MSETYEEMIQEEVKYECAKAYQAGRESMREEAAGVIERHANEYDGTRIMAKAIRAID